MRKWTGSIMGGFFALLFLFLAGCGGKVDLLQATENSLSIDEKGSARLYLVEDFEKEYYDVQELSVMATKEVTVFNSSISREEGTDSPVWIEEVTLLEGENPKVRLVYRFDNLEYYRAFLQEELYLESLESAVSAGRVFIGSVLSGKDGEFILEEEKISALARHRVLITTSALRIYLPGEVLYASPDVVIHSDGSVDTSGCSDAAVILLK